MHGAADPEHYPLQKKKHTLETLREIGHLRTRSNTFGAVFRVRNALARGDPQVLPGSRIPLRARARDFGERRRRRGQHVQGHHARPDCAASRGDFTQDFFGKHTYLTVSGQLEAEIFALAFANVYTFGPTFRAENSNTPRHLAEFYMIEPEMAFCDLNDNQDLAEAFLKSQVEQVLRALPRRPGVPRQVVRPGAAQDARGSAGRRRSSGSPTPRRSSCCRSPARTSSSRRTGASICRASTSAT